jgi:hypothetical protein
VAGAFIHHHLRTSALRRVIRAPPFAGGFAFPRSLRGMLDADSRKRYGNLAGSHVVYAIAACKKYSSSYTPYFSLNLSGCVDG